MQLYSFFNSSASYRVRIALALKGLEYDYVSVNIRSGAQHEPHYLYEINPSPSVPALADGELKIGQSLAIVDYLDSRYPAPRLVPTDPVLRARVLELAYSVACDIHPVNNLRVLRYLQTTLQVSAQHKDAWYRHWIQEGLEVVERLLERHGTLGPWCFGDAPTLADCCLIPQIANAQRMGCDTDGFHRVMDVYEHAMAHPAFRLAEPQVQPDFVS
ncbi:maleylacetoacetate isomerase [Paraburkholderia strydomiana]|uniref:Maleylacetoacetate isomerase n=1 Tax=Paraburkholderia strydomiana TaxID=1245417 RepID=A0ABW9ERI9_9BURK